jgi:surfactin synthase thioesterase subunit
MIDEQDLIYRLRKRAEIRRQIPGRKSVQEGKADRMADLLDEAANEIEKLRDTNSNLGWQVSPDRMGQ